MMRWTLTFLVVAFLLTGETAGGCPSCFAEAEPQQRQAYLGTTVFLSALPLLLLGFLAICIYRGSRRRSEGPITELDGSRRPAKPGRSPEGDVYG